MTAAVNAYLSPNDYPDAEFSYPLRSLVDRVMLSVRGAAKSIERLAPGVAGDAIRDFARR